MSNVHFFSGTLIRQPLAFSFHNGQAQLICRISENWKQLLLHSIRCGNTYTHKLKRSIGITYTEKNDLESLLDGSLGVKGIASLDSQLSTKSGFELQLNRSEEVENEFHFTSPQCGEKIIALYQYQRTIDLDYRDNRPNRKIEWPMHLVYMVDRIHDRSSVIPEIPECGCKSDNPEKGDGKIDIDMGNITMTADFVEYADYLKVPSLGLQINKSQDQNTIVFSSELLPDYLRFLRGDNGKIIHAEFNISPEKIPTIQSPENDVDAILKQLSNLSVLDAANLARKLEQKRGVSATMPIPVAAAASTGFNIAVAEPVEEKTEFDVIIKDAGSKKIETIKVIRQLTSLGLGEAKNMAETAGGKVLSQVGKEAALEAKKKLEEAGADISLE